MSNRTKTKEKREQPNGTYAPPAMTKYLMCRVCRRPMAVGKGQIAFYHRDCRKRRKIGAHYHWNRKSVIMPSKGTGRVSTGARDRI